MNIYSRYSDFAWALIAVASAVGTTVVTDWRFGLGVALVIAAVRDAWVKRA